MCTKADFTNIGKVLVEKFIEDKKHFKFNRCKKSRQQVCKKLDVNINKLNEESKKVLLNYFILAPNFFMNN